MRDIGALYELFKAHPIICTDSRKVEPGCLFFALKGENFDGNRFAKQALDKGAAFAVIDDPEFAHSDRYILVSDVLDTLQRLAQFHRHQFLIPFLAITGSNGKTTTKELISQVLASHYRIYATRGNLNNHIGVPLTLLAIPEEAEIAVVEMGANHQGEIAALCEIAHPTHGIITNIGRAHLEGFGGLEGVKKGKSELYRYLAAHNGVAFVNKDEEHLQELLSPAQRAVFYRRTASFDPHSLDLQVRLEQAEPHIQITFWDEYERPYTANSKLSGMHNFQNVMTAVAIGQYFKVPERKIAAAIESYTPQNMRSQWITAGTTQFLLDAYNANPTSVAKTLDYFAGLDKPHKIAILGAMKELGDYSAEEHERIARQASRFDFEKIILVGDEFKEAARQIAALHFDDTHALAEWYRQQDFSGCTILIKGSRSMKLESLLNNDNTEHAQ